MGFSKKSAAAKYYTLCLHAYPQRDVSFSAGDAALRRSYTDSRDNIAQIQRYGT